MIQKCWLLVSAAMLGSPLPAMAATFTAKAEGNTVTVFSTSDKPEQCEAVVKFTYLSEGKRKDGWTSCGEFATKPGKDVEVCHFTHPDIIKPLLNGGVIGSCKE